MEFVSVDKILKIRSDTKQYVRQMYGFDKPGSLQEAIRILQEWVDKQPHFNKKDFASVREDCDQPTIFLMTSSELQDAPELVCSVSGGVSGVRADLRTCTPLCGLWAVVAHIADGDRCLEVSLITSKGSIERAKSQLDKICTMRTLMPQFFGKYNCKTDFRQLHRVIHFVLLPKLTEDHYRIHITKIFDIDWEPSLLVDFIRHSVIIAEYAKAHDYFCGVVLIYDFSETSVMSVLAKTSLILAKQAMTVLIEGYGMRLKGLHVISDSKFVDGFVSLLKQVVSAKIASRINVHKSVEELHDFYPKDILPKDYGGEERSLKTLNGELLDVLSSEEHLKYLEGMNKATSNESFRPKEQFYEQYAGMPGTFRFLSID